MGEVIFKGHPCWVLMHSIQLGLRYFARRLTRAQGMLLATPNFTANPHFYHTPKTFSFPSCGSPETPAHTIGDFQFKDYCPLAFRFLRTLFGIELRDYINSLCNTTQGGSNPLRLMATPGKSGSLFFFSSDMKYIIKTIPLDETKLLLRILPPYVNYVLNNPNTLLPRFYGLHRVKPHHGREVRLVVMSNLFATEKSIDTRYDLKGSFVLRYVSKAERERKGNSCTLKDENWVEDGRKITIGPERREKFLEQIKKDSAFLGSLGIMDYSLLVGIHNTDNPESTGTKDTQNFLTISNEIVVSDANPGEKGERSLLSTSAMDVSVPKVAEKKKGKKEKKHGGSAGTRESGEQEFMIRPRSDFDETGEGSFFGRDAENERTNEEFFIGIIDILMLYSTRKKAEHYIKTLRYNNSTEISSVPPNEYAKRFYNFIAKHTE